MGQEFFAEDPRKGNDTARPVELSSAHFASRLSHAVESLTTNLTARLQIEGYRFGVEEHVLIENLLLGVPRDPSPLAASSRELLERAGQLLGVRQITDHAERLIGYDGVDRIRERVERAHSQAVEECAAQLLVSSLIAHRSFSNELETFLQQLRSGSRNATSGIADLAALTKLSPNQLDGQALIRSGLRYLGDRSQGREFHQRCGEALLADTQPRGATLWLFLRSTSSLSSGDIESLLSCKLEDRESGVTTPLLPGPSIDLCSIVGLRKDAEQQIGSLAKAHGADVHDVRAGIEGLLQRFGYPSIELRIEERVDGIAHGWRVYHPPASVMLSPLQ